MRRRWRRGYIASSAANMSRSSEVISSLAGTQERINSDTHAANNFNGDNLIECDQKILQEMGIKKVGDRVRIFVAIKQLRNKFAPLRNRRNRDSLAALE